MYLALTCIFLAYLLGSISSSSLVGFLFGNIDMRKELDGRISASTIYRKLGIPAFALTVILDMGLAALAVIIAKMLTDSINVMMLAGLATVLGHNWSIWLKFRGGLGATAIAGVLFAMVFWQFLYALIIAGIVLLITRRSGLSTAVGLMGTCGFLLMQKGVGMLAMYPLMLFTLMLLKRYQLSRETNLAG
jgi:acyl phosphate:glycerol-3-phosphate acyltransferase